MALDKDRLGTDIVDKIAAFYPGGMTPTQKAQIEPYWQAIADAIIEEIKANMSITTTVSIPGAQAGSSTLPGTGQENVIS